MITMFLDDPAKQAREMIRDLLLEKTSGEKRVPFPFLSKIGHFPNHNILGMGGYSRMIDVLI